MSTIKLIQGSAVEQQADAIVNAANRYLAAGGGICGAIFAKAGYAKLQAACDQYNTPLSDGEAVITPAFGITNAKAIIHAVGPNFSETPEAFQELQAAYYNSLKVLMENGFHSIAFPLISSGIFGGNLPNPVAVSVEFCCKAYQAFEKDYPQADVEVLLCVFSRREYQTALNTFESI
ncbi:MAG: macro domain-containing protein [Clostridia bacterium]|nr:macro domain-containing protein [Clostridia bacterium]